MSSTAGDDFFLFLPIRKGDQGQKECQCIPEKPHENVRQIVTVNSLTLIKDASLLLNNTTLNSVWGRSVAMPTNNCHL